MSATRGPCLDCPDRHPGCHGKCEAYLGWVAENRRKRQDEWKRDQNILPYITDREGKITKLSRKKYGAKGRRNKNG